MHFSPEDVRILEAWLENNMENPYPDRKTKLELARQTTLTYQQVLDWFQNCRDRKLKKISKLI